MRGNNWGPWQLSDDRTRLEHVRDDVPKSSWRWIDLERCTSSPEVLDAICHELPGDPDDATLAGLVRALNDLLQPTRNLCSFGKSKTMSPHHLQCLLNQYPDRLK